MRISSLDYEIFTQALHQQLLKEQGFADVNVEHNVALRGRSGVSYQTDVAWRVSIANVTQLFCVECKHWKSRVKKEYISSFLGKLADIGNARGIYVTTVGYQRGAVQLAEQYGVTLISATFEPKKMPATLTIGVPRFSNCSVSVEQELNDEQMEVWKRSLADAEPQIFDASGTGICTLSELLNQYEQDEDGRYSHCPEGYYLPSPWGFLKIAEIAYDYEANVIHGATLHGEYEMAEAVARYISNNREIRAMLPSHR